MQPSNIILEFETYRRGGYVSVWVGNFFDEIDLDEYLGPKFEADFGFRLNDRDMPEVAVEGDKPIHEILEGFSRYRTFKAELSEAVHIMGIDSVTTLVVFYNFCYERRGVSGAETVDKPLQFVGTFTFLPPD